MDEEDEDAVDETASDAFKFSELLESNGFDALNQTEGDRILEQKKKTILNEHMSKLEHEIDFAVRYDNYDKLVDLGAGEQVNINFLIEVAKGLFYTPLMLCVSLGHVDSLKVILENRSLDIDAIEEKSGTNAFWIAAYYGRGQCISLLANANIDILNKSRSTNSNALHIAI